MSQPRPQLVTGNLNKLHPTQLTVGRHEVAQKRREWASLGRKARTATLSSHWFPAILGPEERYYIVDHHHFGLALLEEEIRTVSLMVLKDLSWLSMDNFWRVMDQHQWVHPYDAGGARLDYGAVPDRLPALRDDPYRSLAGAVRRAGGYAKDVLPFSEFQWADFFREQLTPAQLGADFDKAVRKATRLARSHPARYLPGWCGVLESA